MHLRAGGAARGERFIGGMPSAVLLPVQVDTATRPSARVLASKQAENAAEYLGKGSHVNIVGRLRNNNYEKDGEEVYALAFTCEEIDYLVGHAKPWEPA